MRTKQVFIIIAGVILLVILVAMGFTFQQTTQEQLTLSADLQYRTRLLADSLKESVEPAYGRNSTSELQKLVDKFANRERLVGIAIYDNRAAKVAASADLPEKFLTNLPLIGNVMDSDKTAGEFVRDGEKNYYVLVQPVRQVDRVIGAFLVAQNASYIDSGIRKIWESNLARLLFQIFIFALLVALLVRWIVVKPVRKLVDSVRLARTKGEADQALQKIKDHAFFKPLVGEIFKMTKSLSDARLSASEEARMRLEKLDTPWTAERLKEFTKAYLKDRELFVVSNQEPYIHQKTRKGIVASVVPSGLNTAVNSVLEACDGMWIAHGSGDADKETTDVQGKLRVPPQDPHYTLKRVWLSPTEFKGHYSFSVEALYPLFLMTYTRPVFKKEDWIVYRQVNKKYAETLLEELKGVEQPIVLVQDYHFALLPQLIKESRPDAQVAVFWHVPWPSPEAFSVCPWRKEIIKGMLGADVVGFNTQQFCNNFIDTVGKEVESLIDLETFSVMREDHRTYVKAFPISIAFTEGPDAKAETPEAAKNGASILQKLGIITKYVGIGVDRLDYAKGIPERLRGVERFFDAHPEYKEQLSFLQIASPHREHFKEYQEQYRVVIANEVERINQKLETKNWKPIVLEATQYNHTELRNLFKVADFCLITSLHDSMNLVAKEYVAARSDSLGVLILSQFAGASRDLKDAIIVNPHNTEEIGVAIHTALKMLPTEQKRRMNNLRTSVRDYNVYRWAAELIKAVTSLH